MVPHFGVYRVGKVDGRRALVESNDATLGREEVDLVLAEVELQGLQKGDGVRLFLFYVGETLHPRDFFGGGALLVAPVRGDAELRAAVHLLGAYLNFHRLAAGANDRRVQRLVEVELR